MRRKLSEHPAERNVTRLRLDLDTWQLDLSIASFRALTILELRGASAPEQWPAALRHLEQLHTLVVDLPLPVLPEVFFQLPALRELRYVNQRPTSLPSTFAAAPITSLEIRVGDHLPSDLPRLPLTKLVARGPLLGNADVLLSLPGLTELALRDTRRPTLPSQVTRLRRLVRLDLGRHARGAIGEAGARSFDGLTRLPRLEHVDVSGWDFAGALPDSFGRILSLRSLWARRCGLTRLPRRVLSARLEELWVSDNPQLAHLDGLARCRSLHTLHASGTALTELQGPLPALRSLSIDRTRVGELPGAPALASLHAADVVTLRGFDRWEQLRDVWASGAGIERLPEGPAEHLQALHVPYTSVSELPAAPALRSADLRGCPLDAEARARAHARAAEGVSVRLDDADELGELLQADLAGPLREALERLGASVPAAESSEVVDRVHLPAALVALGGVIWPDQAAEAGLSGRSAGLVAFDLRLPDGWGPGPEVWGHGTWCIGRDRFDGTRLVVRLDQDPTDPRVWAVAADREAPVALGPLSTLLELQWRSRAPQSPPPQPTEPVGDKWKEHAMVAAAGHGDLEAVDRWLAEGVDVNVKPLNDTALDLAGAAGNLDMAQALLERGAMAVRGTIYKLCLKKQTGVLRRVLDAGAFDPTHEGLALGTAIDKGLEAMVGPLLDAGVGDPDQQEWNGPVLFLACKAGRGEAARALLTRGADPTCQHEGGYAVLWTGVHADLATLRAFLDAGLSMDHEALEHAMFQALAKDAAAYVRGLLDLGYGVERSTRGASPLAVAAQYGAREAVAALVAADAAVRPDHGPQPHDLAVLADRDAVAKELERLGAPASSVPSVVRAIRQGDKITLGEVPVDARTFTGTLLHEACRAGNTHALRALHTAGANLDAVTRASGEVPLTVASINKQWVLVKLLLGFGASVAPDPSGRTALVDAARHGQSELVEALLDADCSLEGVDTKGQTALMLAASGGHVAIVQRLLAAGAVVDVRSASGTTALVGAAASKRWDALEPLLLAGADPDAVSDEGNTSLHYAAKAGHAGAVKALLGAGADPLVRIKLHEQTALDLAKGDAVAIVKDAVRRGESAVALALAAQNGRLDTMRQLLRAGVSPDGQGAGKLRVLHHAVAGGHVEAIELLLAAGGMHLARLSRWSGAQTFANPLLAVLHVAYFLLPLGALMLGAAILLPDLLLPAAAQHIWMAGAIGLMTIAVMTRATLGHTGQPLAAGAATVAIYAAILISVLARLAAGLLPEAATAFYHLSATGWIIGFAGFALRYGPLLLTRAR